MTESSQENKILTVSSTKDYATRGFGDRRGFTLIEVVTAIGVALVVGGLLVRLYIVTQGALDVQHDKLRQTSHVRQVLWELKRDLRAAAKVVPAWRSYRTDRHAVVLELPALDGRQRALPTVKDRIVYQSTDAGIRRIVAPDARSSRTAGDTTLTDGDTTLSFTYSDTTVESANLVTVHLENRRKTKRRESTFPATITVRLRNHG